MIDKGELRRLRQAFEYVRKTFFPTWDRKQEWKLRKDKKLSRYSLEARCFSDLKTIIIGQVPEEDTDLYHLIIHEICHSSKSYFGHANGWRERFLTKAQIARKLSLTNLAQKIEEQVEKYRKEEAMMKGISFSQFYCKESEECFLQNGWPSNTSYYEFLRHISSTSGMPPREFEKKCKKIKQVFYQTREKARRYEEIGKLQGELSAGKITLKEYEASISKFV